VNALKPPHDKGTAASGDLDERPASNNLFMPRPRMPTITLISRYFSRCPKEISDLREKPAELEGGKAQPEREIKT
jgi:hypothetical protein